MIDATCTFFGLLPVLDDMISDIGFIGLKYSIGTALKYWEYVAFKYWDQDRRDIFGISTALISSYPCTACDVCVKQCSVPALLPGLLHLQFLFACSMQKVEGGRRPGEFVT